MIELLFASEDYSSFRDRLLVGNFESCGVLFTNLVKTKNSVRLIVQQAVVAPPDAYRKRNTSQAILTPSFVASACKTALRNSQGLVFVHTHPWDENIPKFSSIDDAGENLIYDFLNSRGLKTPSLAMVFGRRHCRARLMPSGEDVKVLVIGNTQEIVAEPTTANLNTATHDRQVRLLGEGGQKRLTTARVGIVGLGGTGSVTAQQLAYLGVKDFVLVVHFTKTVT